jgi:hypothetical protein
MDDNCLIHDVVSVLLQQGHLGIFEAFSLAHTSKTFYRWISGISGQEEVRHYHTKNRIGEPQQLPYIDWCKCEEDEVFRVCAEHNKYSAPIDLQLRPLHCVLEGVNEKFIKWLLSFTSRNVWPNGKPWFFNCAWTEVGRSAQVELVMDTNILAKALGDNPFMVGAHRRCILESELSSIFEGMGTQGSFEYAFDMAARLNDHLRNHLIQQGGERDPLAAALNDNNIIHSVCYGHMMRSSHVNGHWEFLMKCMESYYLPSVDTNMTTERDKSGIRKVCRDMLGVRSFEHFCEMYLEMHNLNRLA